MPFRLKVALMLSGIVLLLGTTATLYARLHMQQILSDELEQRGEAIARDIAADSVDLLLTDDLVGATEHVARIRENNPNVRYVLLLSSSNEVLINSFGSTIPRGLLESNPLRGADAVQLKRIKTEEGLIRDLAAPILGGTVGVVRVGMSDRNLQMLVAENTRDLFVLLLATVGIAFTVSYWLSYHLTSPLSRLLSVVQSVTQGDLSRRIDAPSGGEVGQISHAFNVMADELERKEAARRALTEKIITSQEEERKRVARELHDDLAQGVTSVLLSLEVIANSLDDKDTRSQKAIERSRSIAETNLAGIRKLITDLRPTVLDDLAMVPAIRSYAEDSLRSVGTKVEFQVDGAPSSLSSIEETAVYRIVQEAISNIVRHAGATRATISLRYESELLRGEVTDDGHGFTVNGSRPDTKSGSGLGLMGMRERATLIGGNLSVASQAGGGTRVSFVVPILQS